MLPRKHSGRNLPALRWEKSWSQRFERDLSVQVPPNTTASSVKYLIMHQTSEILKLLSRLLILRNGNGCSNTVILMIPAEGDF